MQLSEVVFDALESGHDHGMKGGRFLLPGGAGGRGDKRGEGGTVGPVSPMINAMLISIDHGNDLVKIDQYVQHSY